MSGINRIDQKVVCIWPTLWFTMVCSTKVHPVENETYTVAGFADICGEPGVHLRELAGFTCECRGIDGGSWPLRAFRPVDQRKTDISELEKLLDVTPVKAPTTKPKVDA